MDEEEPAAEREVGGAGAEVAASPPRADAMVIGAANPGGEGATGRVSGGARVGRRGSGSGPRCV